MHGFDAVLTNSGSAQAEHRAHVCMVSRTSLPFHKDLVCDGKALRNSVNRLTRRIACTGSSCTVDRWENEIQPEKLSLFAGSEYTRLTQSGNENPKRRLS